MDRERRQANHPNAAYNRPNEKWVCGHAKDGCETCPRGPSPKGECGASEQCHPIRKGDRYSCTRSKSLGGKCTEGPLPDGRCSHIIPPCSPRLSQRAFRTRLSLVAVVITVTGVIFLLSGPEAEEHLSPGPLTSHHTTSSSCKDCHSNSGEAILLSSKVLKIHERALANSQLCLNCHNLGENALNPHNLSQAELTRLGASSSENTPESSAPLILAAAKQLTAQKNLACASCHNEHQGPNFDMKAMSDAQCQSCHQTQFHSFDKGHPPFNRFPKLRQSGILFDHNTHILEHFKKREFEEIAPNDCLSCHELSDRGIAINTKGFDLSCAKCHGKQIAGKGRGGALGIPVLQLPGIDTQTLRDKGYPVGSWPEYADGTLTPFLEEILLNNPESAQALKTLESADCLDLRDASDVELQAATDLLWSIKALFFKALTTDQQYLQASLLDEDHPERQSDQVALSGQIPLDTLLAAQKAWFPELLHNLPRYTEGLYEDPTPPPENAKPKVDTPLPKQEAPTAANQDDDLLASNESENDLLMSESTAPDDSLLSSAEVDLHPANDTANDLLLETESDSLPGDVEDSLLTGQEDLLSSKGDDFLGGGDDLLLSNGSSSGGDLLSSDVSAKPEPKPAEIAAPENWTVHGGWYRSDSRYTIYYRPSGHADRFLKAWIDHSAPNPYQSTNRLALFEQLTEVKAPGLCMKCHHVETSKEVTTIHWDARHTETERKFTRFAHAPHFKTMEERGCISCHQLDKDSRTNKDELTHSNFMAMPIQACASCHNAKTQTNQCLNCHNYHIGEVNQSHPKSSWDRE